MTNYRARPIRQMANDAIVVDLQKNNRIQRLIEWEDISDDLTDDEERKLVSYVKAAFRMSYDQISKRYPHWLEADRAHDVYVRPDATAFREKAVISDTRAVADTVVTYLMSALAGRNPMFQLEGEDRKSRRVAALHERILHKQMRQNAGEAKVAQMLTDCVRYGFAPTKVTWIAQKNSNIISNFDPRRAFPDPRVSWGDWENMRFIGFSSFTSFDSLRRTALYPKLERYPSLREFSDTRAAWECNKFRKEQGRGLSIDPQRTSQKDVPNQFFGLGSARAVNELWLCLSGHEVNVPQLVDLWLVVTILDEEVCIRLQANPNGRNFPTVIGGLFNDFHKTYSQSLYDLILPVHDIATWLLRSRVDNVQAALNNLIFVDPTVVNIADLIDRNPFGLVRTLPGAKPGEGFFVAPIPDVTRGHWQDIQLLSDLKQRVAAASDAQQGMPTADVRTATEIQRLTQLGSQRLGVLSRVLSSTTVRPMVRMMVDNVQDALAYEGSIRMDPYNTPGILSEMVKDGYIDFTVEDLQGHIDYLIIDGTLPTEPSRSAETWLNMLQVMSQTGLGQEYKMGMIAEEAVRSMGIHDLDKFRITPEERQQGPSPSQRLELMEKMRGSSVQPTEQVMDEMQKGNLVPISQAPKGRTAA